MKRFEFLRLPSAALITAALAAVAQAGPPEPGGGTDNFLLVASYDTNSVLRYDETTGAFVDTFVPKNSGGLSQPYGVVFGPHDHNLYVSSGQFGGPGRDKAVLRYDGTTGAFMGAFADSTHLTSPRGIIFGPDGSLYVADGDGPGTIVRYDGTTGAFLDNFVPTGSGGLSHPQGLVFGPSGRGPRNLDLYVSGAIDTESVLRYDGTTGAFLGEFVAVRRPGGLTFGPDGNLYVAEFGTSVVLRFRGPTGPTPGAPMPSAGNSGAVFVASGSGGLLTPFGLVFGPDGNGDGQQDLYVTSTHFQNHLRARQSTVKRYDGVTGAFIDTFVTVNSGGLDDPGLMTFTETDPVTLNYLGGPAQHAVIHAVPEPTCLLLASLGAAGTAVHRWRRHGIHAVGRHAQV